MLEEIHREASAADEGPHSCPTSPAWSRCRRRVPLQSTLSDRSTPILRMGVCRATRASASNSSSAPVLPPAPVLPEPAAGDGGGPWEAQPVSAEAFFPPEGQDG